MTLFVLVLMLLQSPAPNARLTPGAVRPLSVTEVCSTRWGRDVRKVTQAMKQHVAAAYGVRWADHARYEFDHLIPRSLAGADDELNLWPQAWALPYGAHQKDLLENELHRRVCAGSMTLPAAQQAIRSDWQDAFRRYVPARLHPRQ
jgi:hypothetical protein